MKKGHFVLKSSAVWLAVDEGQGRWEPGVFSRARRFGGCSGQRRWSSWEYDDGVGTAEA
jgi:hypothetical protein